MLKSSRKYWVIALVCGLAAALLFNIYIQQVKTKYEPDDLVDVIRANVDISRDSLITRDMIETVQLPGKYVHHDAIQVSQDVVGKITCSDISSGEILLYSKLADSKAGEQRLAYKIPQDKRAVTIGTDSITGVAGYLQKGDRVDVFATIDIEQSSSGSIPYTVLALQDILILETGSAAELDQKSETVKRTITLAVAPQQALPLILASERGTVRLALRSPIDKNLATLTPFQKNDLLYLAPAQPTVQE
ncbi:MAG: Flp pilus assembly protein CpaB [Syntrophomonadaceae bacterium]|nr:Flp pilus assembly protein CpaB [Syntrophomonadaceae bacterium]